MKSMKDEIVKIETSMLTLCKTTIQGTNLPRVVNILFSLFSNVT